MRGGAIAGRLISATNQKGLLMTQSESSGDRSNPVENKSSTRFIAVVHRWFVHSKGFRVVRLKSTNLKDATDEAALIDYRSSGDFCSSAVRLIKLEAGERLARKPIPGERLTIRERITGRVSTNRPAP